jgi:hydrogenase maturation protease
MIDPAPVRVVGIGSANGDDAAAWQAVKLVRDALDTHNRVEFHLVDGAERLLDILDGRGTLILVDALKASSEPAGSIHRLGWPDDRIPLLRGGSTHGMGPAEALELADTLGLLPRWVVIFGVEAKDLSGGGDICPPVAAALPELARSISMALSEVIRVAAEK